MIFIDSNVPMYMIGAPHPNKTRTLELVNRLVRQGEHLVTDVEVYQEILHRYTAVRRTDAIDAAFASLDTLADEVLTFGMVEIREARSIIDAVDGVSPRDALHVAIMRSNRIGRLLSFDRGFDAFSELERLH